jgi:hypothetical protein
MGKNDFSTQQSRAVRQSRQRHRALLNGLVRPFDRPEAMRQFAGEKNDITRLKVFVPSIDLQAALAERHQVKAGLTQAVFG